MKGNSIDLGVALGTGITCFGADQFLLNSPSAGKSGMDATYMTVANIAGQAVSVGDLIPLPDGLDHIADALGTGVIYATANHVSHHSPFNNFFTQTIYGAVCDFVGEHVINPIFNSATGLNL